MLSEEQKTAKKMLQLLNRLDLDLEMVGRQIAQTTPSTYYNRFVIVAEAAVEEKEDARNTISY